MVLNFVSNAIRHAQSRVDVALGLRQEGGLLVVSVMDDGPGVPAEMQKHLFSGQPRKAGLKVRVGLSPYSPYAAGGLTKEVLAGERCRARSGDLLAHGHDSWRLRVV